MIEFAVFYKLNSIKHIKININNTRTKKKQQQQQQKFISRKNQIKKYIFFLKHRKINKLSNCNRSFIFRERYLNRCYYIYLGLLFVLKSEVSTKRKKN